MTTEPGRELDALVAEKVMGWTYHREPYKDAEGEGWVSISPDGTEGFADYKHAPPYSTDIAAAWEVVEEVRKRGNRPDDYSFPCDGFALSQWSVGQEWENFEAPKDGWVATFDLVYGGKTTATAMTAPHAICLAALKLAQQ